MDRGALREIGVQFHGHLGANGFVVGLLNISRQGKP
jgi:hypothetical protein